MNKAVSTALLISSLSIFACAPAWASYDAGKIQSSSDSSHRTEFAGAIADCYADKFRRFWSQMPRWEQVANAGLMGIFLAPAALGYCVGAN